METVSDLKPVVNNDMSDVTKIDANKSSSDENKIDESVNCQN